jgi:peptidoglycan LD-endopeptidase CwlK
MESRIEKKMKRNQTVKYPYSKSSLEKLQGVHPKLIDFAFELANIIDCRLVYGVRSDEEQHKLFKEGRSSKDGYEHKSNHQTKEDGYGYALDILPLPKNINMYSDDGSEDNIRWGQFDGACHALAHMMGIKIRTGFKWRDNLMDSLERPERENNLPDGNHVELVI